ncbi:MAG: hypothetical protein JRF63_14985, partial [Deltaproteobacteria bacterium]|nr:hypothetical protein [Deltaproteobacteria bacterium]
ALVLISTGARAAEVQEDEPAFRSSLDVGFGMVDEDGFFLLLLEQGFSGWGLDVVLSGPLRFRAVDRAPADDGVLREQDWDEPSDFARIPRSIRFATDWNNGAFDMRFGELNGVGLGHGSVVDAYYNSTDMDHYQGGLVISGEYAGNGLELLTENVVQPEVLVGRAFIAPLGWFLEGDWPRRLELGFTLAADISIPYRVDPDHTGTTAVPITGGDISLKIIDTTWGVAAPYVDVMAMDGDLGVHAGLATTWTLSEEKQVLLHARGEYRYLGSDYHPSLFNPFYERNRRHYGVDPVTGESMTLADALALHGEDNSHGMMFDLSFDAGKKVLLGARYDREGSERPHWIMFRLDLAPWEAVSLAMLYAGQDLGGGAGLFSWDSLIAAAVQVRIWGPLRAFAEFTRRFRRVGADMDLANETGAGVGVVFTY